MILLFLEKNEILSIKLIFHLIANMQSDDMIGNITEHYISHVKLSDITDNQKKELLNYTQNVSIIQKEYKKHENGYKYYIKLNVGWDIITYKYSFHTIWKQENESKFSMLGLNICNNDGINTLILDNKMPQPDICRNRLIEAFSGCRLFKEMVDFTNKIIQLDNIPHVIFNSLEFYRKALFHINQLNIPHKLRTFKDKILIDIVIDDGTNFDLNKSFLHQNVKYHYIITSDIYDFKFIENNAKLNIYMQDVEPFYTVKFKQHEFDTFAKFFKNT